MMDRKRNIPEEIVFAVCEKVIRGGEGATSVAKWVQDQGYHCSRERVYPLLARGIERGFVRLHPPEEMALAQRLASRFAQGGGDIRVFKSPVGATNDHLAAAGAELALSLIREIGTHNRPVHIGFGAGNTMRRVARDLAFLLRSEPDVPPLVLHALSSGFSVEKPITAPVSFFSLFGDLDTPIEYVGLFAPAVVDWEAYDEVRDLPGVRESFAAAPDVDIILSSLACHVSHDHGLLKKLMRMTPQGKQGLKNLEREGWVGDVMFRPYSAVGPIEENTGVRAVTMFELEELVRLTRTPGKHVILLAGCCDQCGASKSVALRPLFEHPDLHVFNHVLTDVGTARQLLG